MNLSLAEGSEENLAGDKGERADKRVVVMRGRGMLHVTLGLGEAVNPIHTLILGMRTKTSFK